MVAVAEEKGVVVEKDVEEEEGGGGRGERGEWTEGKARATERRLPAGDELDGLLLLPACDEQGDAFGCRGNRRVRWYF